MIHSLRLAHHVRQTHGHHHGRRESAQQQAARLSDGECARVGQSACAHRHARASQSMLTIIILGRIDYFPANSYRHDELVFVAFLYEYLALENLPIQVDERSVLNMNSTVISRDIARLQEQIGLSYLPTQSRFRFLHLLIWSCFAFILQVHWIKNLVWFATSRMGTFSRFSSHCNNSTKCSRPPAR